MALQRPRDRTLVQEGQGWNGRYDVRTDAVCVYGVDATLPERVATWRARGYRVHLMTGLAWGHYQEYLLGRWDDREHWDEAQRAADGKPRLHGPDIPYMTPSPAYGEYLGTLLKQALAAGVEAIFLEEPEFWANTGYGPGFERAWVARYSTPYRDPAGDAATFAQAAELKYALYRDLIAYLCDLVRHETRGRPEGPVPCYVATHSLLNYAHNRIVSPMHALRDIASCDGAIVQVWSHTARSQVLYEGVRGERMFEVAFLEYGSGLELTRGLDRDLWFLADPVEDSPIHGWDRYRAGYRTTVAASLCFPEVRAFEVMPWPSRVFTSRFPRRPEGQSGDLIPADYAAELLTIANALRAVPDASTGWDHGTPGVGVLTADSLMFRRAGPDQDDPELSAFYGLALPPLLAGMPVRPISLEAVARYGVPPAIRVLILSYDGMTPPSSAAHEALAAWVRAGNALILFGAADGPYETAPGWWNVDGYGQGPWPHLHALLGLRGEPGLSRAGAGLVLVEREGPIALARDANGAASVRARIRQAMEALADGTLVYREQGHILARRGPYLIAAALSAPPGGDRERIAFTLRGRFVDLFDGRLPLRERVDLRPGETALLIDLAETPSAGAYVLAASGRVEHETPTECALTFLLSGPISTPAVIRLRLPSAPTNATVNGAPIECAWDQASRTALLRGNNTPDGLRCAVQW